MALPVVESVASNSSISGGSVTVTAPTGIATGDLLIGSYTSFRPSGSQTANTPAGWTLVSTRDDNSKLSIIAFYKVAVLADETASDYTFTATSADYMQASILRVSGTAVGSEITVSENVYINGNAATVISHTASSTPAVGESLLVVCAGGSDLSITAAVTTSTYTSTPTVTWTERMDLGYRDGASDGSSHAVATAPYTGTTEFTAYGYTISEVLSEVVALLFMVNAPQNVAGTNALLSVSPTQFAQTGSAGTTGTNLLHEADPEFFSQSGAATSPTVWTNETKESTTWTNEQK